MYVQLCYRVRYSFCFHLYTISKEPIPAITSQQWVRRALVELDDLRVTQLAQHLTLYTHT